MDKKIRKKKTDKMKITIMNKSKRKIMKKKIIEAITIEIMDIIDVMKKNNMI